MARKFTPEYPPEFRSEAVRLVRDGGRTISAAAKDLGVSAESLRHWVKQDALDSGLRKDGLTSEERKELVRLRRENRDLREDREILKKAALGSTHRRNGRLEYRTRSLEAKGLTRSTVHSTRNRVELSLRVHR